MISILLIGLGSSLREGGARADAMFDSARFLGLATVRVGEAERRLMVSESVPRGHVLEEILVPPLSRPDRTPAQHYINDGGSAGWVPMSVTLPMLTGTTPE